MKRWPALIGVLAVVAAGPALRNGFVYDDVQAIVENPLVHSLANSPRIWVSSYWPSGLLYRPLTIQLFTVEWWLGGGAPWVFHLGGLLLYTAVAGVLFRIARRLLPHAAGGGGRWQPGWSSRSIRCTSRSLPTRSDRASCSRPSSS